MSQSTQPPKPRVLLITGGPVHDYDATDPILTDFLARRFEVHATRDLAELENLGAGRYDAVLLHLDKRNGEMTDARLQALQDFLANGGGLVALHGATTAFRDQPGYQKLIGTEFIGHGPVLEFTVRFTDPEHPCAARCDAFRVVDELYLLKDHSDYHTFAVAHWQGQDRPMGYEKKVGKGRLIYLANGHDPQSVGNRYVQRMLERALRYACGETFDKQVKVGVLGYGGAFNMGLQHANATNAQLGMNVVAVCDADPARAAQAQADLPGVTTSTDMDAFFNEGQFDLCIAILPHNLHAAACIKAAQAGKHIITEKPFCVGLAEADEMIAEADKAGVMLSCYHNRRWDGDFLALLHEVRSGVLGYVYRTDAASGGYAEPGSWWRSSKEISGGIMYDWGAHFTDWVLNLMDRPIASVVGDVQKRKWHHVTNEDYAYALVRFEDGSTATIEQGSMVSFKRDKFRILGTDGGLRKAGPEGVERMTYDGLRPIQSIIPDIKADGANRFYQNIGNHLIMGEDLIVKPNQARRVIGVIELANRSSAEGGKPMELPGEKDYKPDYQMPW